MKVYSSMNCADEMVADGERLEQEVQHFRPLNTNPQDRERLLALCTKVELSDDANAIELADLVKQILLDEQHGLDHGIYP